MTQKSAFTINEWNDHEVLYQKLKFIGVSGFTTSANMVMCKKRFVAITKAFALGDKKSANYLSSISTHLQWMLIHKLEKFWSTSKGYNQWKHSDTMGHKFGGKINTQGKKKRKKKDLIKINHKWSIFSHFFYEIVHSTALSVPTGRLMIFTNARHIYAIEPNRPLGALS